MTQRVRVSRNQVSVGKNEKVHGGLDRILSIREAFDLLSIPVDELMKFYAGQREIT